MVPVGTKIKEASQHKGVGRTLITMAEKMTKDNDYNGISVISGEGVREYYKNNDYIYNIKSGRFMIKKLYTIEELTDRIYLVIKPKYASCSYTDILILIIFIILYYILLNYIYKFAPLYALRVYDQHGFK